MKISVSELIVRFMEALKIEHIFGMPGAHILPVYDSLFDSKITAILAKHEQGASFMAGGYNRVSGKISACITTAGPGATNLVTGIANAYVDKQAILIICGETPTHIFGKGGLQESSGEGGSIDQGELFKSITGYHKLIERTDYLANVLNRTAKVLLSESPSPVLLSIPFNIQKEKVDENLLDQITTSKVNYHHSQFYSPIIADEIISLLKKSKSPIIVAGNGCIVSGAKKAVSQLSELMNIPVTTSLKAKGVVSEQSHLSLGSLGVTSHGGSLQYIVNKADLVIFLGASFNERTSYVWNENLLRNKKIIQIDNNREQLEKVFKADIAILGDISAVLSNVNIKLAALLKEQKLSAKEIQGSLQKYRAHGPQEDKDQNLKLSERFPLVDLFYQQLQLTFKKQLMVFDDNIIFAQNFFHVSAENNYYPNSGISSLGHAIPAAIGAQFTLSKKGTYRPVFAIIGDGGFQMCCMEIMTAINYQLPLTIVLLNNSSMGLIRKNQSQQYQQRYINCDFTNPDYELLSKSFGMKYYKVEKSKDLIGLLAKLDYHKAINLIEIILDKNIFPGYFSKR
jgi:acetolactate synthase-1/2/3 large subunit